MKNKSLIYVDLNRAEYGLYTVSLNNIGAIEDIKKNNISLSEGDILWCWSDTGIKSDPFIFPIQIFLDKESKIWFGKYKIEELLRHSDYLAKNNHSWDEIVKDL